MSYEEVVFERSYLTLLLLNRAIPGIAPLDSDNNDDTDGVERRVKSKVTHKKIEESCAADFFMNMIG